jgi:hypothetical protein
MEGNYNTAYPNVFPASFIHRNAALLFPSGVTLIGSDPAISHCSELISNISCARCLPLPAARPVAHDAIALFYTTVTPWGWSIDD